MIQWSHLYNANARVVRLPLVEHVVIAPAGKERVELDVADRLLHKELAACTTKIAALTVHQIDLAEIGADERSLDQRAECLLRATTMREIDE